jgi:hypothetical protein
MAARAQLLMGPTEIVAASNQIHSGLQGLETMNGMTTFARERSQPFTHRGIEAFYQGGIERFTSCGLLQECLRFLKGSSCQTTRDFHHAFFLRVLDDGGNTELWPDFQTAASSARRPFHFFAKGTQDALWVRIPAISADEETLHDLTTPANLLE